MIKTLLLSSLILFALSQFTPTSSYSYIQPLIGQNNYQFSSNRLYAPNQYDIFNNAYGVNDAIRMKQLNTMRDASMGGPVGDIRRSLKGEIDRIMAAETRNIGNYNSPFGYSSNLII